MTSPASDRQDADHNDCEDQGMMPTDHCLKFGCDDVKFVLRGKFWCCPNCGASYGEHAKQGLRESDRQDAPMPSVREQITRAIDDDWNEHGFIATRVVDVLLSLPADYRLALSRALCPDTHEVLEKAWRVLSREGFTPEQIADMERDRAASEQT